MPEQHALRGALQGFMPAQQPFSADPVAAAPPRQQQQQQLNSPYGKVAAWLNNTYSNGISNNSVKARAGSGPPLIARFNSSLLWYIGLGGALHHKHRTGVQHHQQTPQQQQPPAGADSSAADGGAAPAVTTAAGSASSTAAAAAGGAGMAAPMQPGLPISHQGVLKSVSSGPGSHPLTLQQVEQSMGFSTSSSSAAPGTAPVQALAKGKATNRQLVECLQCLQLWELQGG